MFREIAIAKAGRRTYRRTTRKMNAFGGRRHNKKLECLYVACHAGVRIHIYHLVDVSFNKIDSIHFIHYLKTSKYTSVPILLIMSTQQYVN